MSQDRWPSVLRRSRRLIEAAAWFAGRGEHDGRRWYGNRGWYGVAAGVSTYIPATTTGTMIRTPLATHTTTRMAALPALLIHTDPIEKA